MPAAVDIECAGAGRQSADDRHGFDLMLGEKMHRHNTAQYQNIQPGNMITDKQGVLVIGPAMNLYPHAQGAGNAAQPAAGNAAAERAWRRRAAKKQQAENQADYNQEYQQQGAVEFS